MCGIAGLVHWGRRDRAELVAVVDRMDQAVAQRGPDGHGREVIEGPDGVAVFAHRRLAILDRSDAGLQPMSDAARRMWLTFNGEIYNYRELAGRVVSSGVTLRSSSDTEVLVEMLAAEGGDAVGRLRGMFACAAFDVQTGALTLARDRFGIKPLVWCRPSPDLILFASTPQALAASGLLSLTPAPGRRAEFLAHGSIASSHSFWHGVHIVPPATILRFDRDVPSASTYWTVGEVMSDTPSSVSLASAADTCRAAIVDSVGAHLVSDVPVAVFLSGGLDSSAIAAAARQASGVDLRTITVTMPGSSLDESAVARATATRLGTVHTEVSVGDINRDVMLDAFFAAMAQPSVDGVNTFLVARAASEAGVQVVLSGMGGDELFGGYPSFVEVPRLHALLSRWSGGVRAGGVALRRWPSSRLAKLTSMAHAPSGSLSEVWWAYRGVWPAADAEQMTGERVERPGEAAGGSPFDTIRTLEWRQFLERQLLPDADAFTMCRALELRVPFVDHQLVEAVARAGRWPRGRHRTWKAALFSQWLDWQPAAPAGRKKQGFILPMDTWLRQALTSPAPRVWRDVADRLRRPAHASAVDDFLARRSHWTRVWALYVLDRMTDNRS